MNWISVKDKLPLEEENEDCIILIKGSMSGEGEFIQHVTEACYDWLESRWVCIKSIFSWGSDNCYFPEEYEHKGLKWVVTHWMYVKVE
jgi:hypothetical protein